jgi:hypothetical protein
VAAKEGPEKEMKRQNDKEERWLIEEETKDRPEKERRCH